MDKYYGMVNPPRFNGEWKYQAFFLLDILIVGMWLFFARTVNNMIGLSLMFAAFNYVLAVINAILMVWRPTKNPDQRQIFVVFEALFFSDKNKYHALDQNRNYHGSSSR